MTLSSLERRALEIARHGACPRSTLIAQLRLAGFEAVETTAALEAMLRARLLELDRAPGSSRQHYSTTELGLEQLARAGELERQP